MKPNPILLLSCYELGHQPLSLAWPLAMLKEADLPATGVDLAVEDFPTEAAAQAQLIAIAVPMHTAMRIGVDAARRARKLNPAAHIAFFGLYAWMNRDYLLGDDESERLADSVLAGETENNLLTLAQTVLNGDEPSLLPGVTTRQAQATPTLTRLDFPLPLRQGLPDLGEYARYTENGTAYPAGYVEASRGCLHTCRHCPVVPIYQGRFFIVQAQTVLADIRQQVKAGARHITFGDPDFLNGPGHARKIVRALHEEFPQVTFNFTTKVEHILEHEELILEMGKMGCTFVVSAFESTSELVLEKLHKGHTVPDMEGAIAILRRAGIAPQPTWMPFTPWTSLDDYLHLLSWIREQDLVNDVPAVQLSIRMLVPPESALLDEPGTDAWLGELDQANFTYRWTHPDPRVDELQRTVTRIAEQGAEEAADDEASSEAFTRIEAAAYALAQRPLPERSPLVRFTVQPPRLTENWFC